jgi:CRP-like cAMP-binding protein
MFFVTSGEVVLERHAQNGHVACLQRTRNGFVGEASLTSRQYHCDARTTLCSDLTRIPIASMRLALQEDGNFAQRWIRMLSQEVCRLRLQNERLSLPRLEDRLIHLIETEGDSNIYPLTASLKDIAKELAVTHEALYRCLARLEDAGRIRREAHAIVVLKS